MTSAARATRDNRLKVQIMGRGPDAVEAAVRLLERHHPASLEQAQISSPDNSKAAEARSTATAPTERK